MFMYGWLLWTAFWAVLPSNEGLQVVISLPPNLPVCLGRVGASTRRRFPFSAWPTTSRPRCPGTVHQWRPSAMLSDSGPDQRYPEEDCPTPCSATSSSSTTAPTTATSFSSASPSALERVVWRIGPGETASQWDQLRYRLTTSLQRMLQSWQLAPPLHVFVPSFYRDPLLLQAEIWIQLEVDDGDDDDGDDENKKEDESSHRDRGLGKNTPPFSLLQRGRKVVAGRFGFTMQAGPAGPLLQDALHDLFPDDSSLEPNAAGEQDPPRVAAVIFMSVDPAFRKQGLGRVAWQIMAYLHHQLARCPYTLLVADDDGTGRLIQWYQQQGFVLAPQLQNMVGSDDQGRYGWAMLASTRQAHALPPDTTLEWWS